MLQLQMTQLDGGEWVTEKVVVASQQEFKALFDHLFRSSALPDISTREHFQKARSTFK